MAQGSRERKVIADDRTRWTRWSVLGGDVTGVPFVFSPPNGGEIRVYSWQAIFHIGNSPRKLQRRHITSGEVQ